jgi:hypothetical protein
LSHIPPLARTVSALPGQPTVEEAERALALIREALAWARNPREATDAAKAFVRLAPRSTVEAFAGSVIEVLKYPTAGREVTEVLVGAVREAIPQSNGGSSDMAWLLTWASDRLPDQISTAPRCPKARGAGRSCPAGER